MRKPSRCVFLVWLSLVAFLLNQTSWAAATAAPVQAHQPGQSGANIDLSATANTVAASRIVQTGSVNIIVGGAAQTITPASVITPAMAVAAAQVLNTGAQSLVIAAQGNAVGGTFRVPNLSRAIANLVIPQGVTAIKNFGATPSLNVAGNLNNAGIFYAISSNPQVTSASINAANIVNQSGALLTSVLPAAGLPGLSNLVSNLSLNLSAVNNIVNSGTIASAGHLTATAGGSIINALPAGVSGPSPLMQAMNNLNLTSASGNIVNSGLIAAVAGNINVASQLTTNLNINNLGGVLQALAGSINVRDAGFIGKADLTINGGQLLAKELNLYSGAGNITVNADKLLGTLNLSGNGSHVLTGSGDLTLGNICLTGDPTFYNNNGSIVIGGDITVGEDLAIVASGNIVGSGNFNITAGLPIIPSTKMPNITLIAGAGFNPNPTGQSSGTVGPLSGTQGTGSPAGPITLSGFSSLNGGNIDFSQNTGTISTAAPVTSGRSGGDVVMAAFRGAFGSNGQILLASLPQASTSTFTPGTAITIKTSGDGVTGNNGNVTLIAGASSPTGNITAIQTGPIVAAGGAGILPNTGNIALFTAQPQTQLGPLTFDTHGTAQGNNTLTAGPTTLTHASVAIYGDINASNSISVTAGGDIQAFHQEIVRILLPTTGAFAGSDPQGVAFDPSGQVVFVTERCGPSCSGLFSPLFTIPTSTNSLGTVTSTLGPNSLGVAVSGSQTLPASDVVFVVNSNQIQQPTPNGTLSLLQLSIGPIPTNAAVGSMPVGVALHPSGTFAYVVNSNTANPASPQPGSLTVVNAIAKTTGVTVPVGSNPQTVSVDPSGAFAYVTSAGDGKIAVISLAAPSSPVVVNSLNTGGTNPTGVAINPVTAYGLALVTNFGGPSDSVYSTAVINTANGGSLSGQVQVGKNPSGIAFNPAGTFAYVTNQGSNTVSVINSATNAVMETINVGSAPRTFGNFAGFVAGHPTAFVSNSGGNSVSVLQMPLLTAPKVNLNSTNLGSPGNITVATNARSPALDALTAKSFGNVSITQAANVNINGALSGAGGTFQLGSLGVINIIGTVAAQKVFITSPGNQGNNPPFPPVPTPIVPPLPPPPPPPVPIGPPPSFGPNIGEESIPTVEVVSFAAEEFSLETAAEETSSENAVNIAIAHTLPVDTTPPTVQGQQEGQMGEGPANETTGSKILSGNGPEIEGGEVSTNNMNSQVINNLSQSGITSGPGSGGKYFNLDKGNALFSPDGDIVVGTHEGNVFIEEGSEAFITETGNDVAIYNLHDRRTGGIKVVVGTAVVTVPPGKQLVLTRKKDATFEEVNPDKKIAYRNPKALDLPGGVKGFLADFSIPSAILGVGPIRQLMKSVTPAERKLAYKMLKNAVIMADVFGAAGPYKTAQ